MDGYTLTATSDISGGANLGLGRVRGDHGGANALAAFANGPAGAAAPAWRPALLSAPSAPSAPPAPPAPPQPGRDSVRVAPYRFFRLRCRLHAHRSVRPLLVAAVFPVRVIRACPALRQWAITHVPAGKIVVDPGSAVDPVHYDPPNQPLNPNQPQQLAMSSNV
jgi:hypothetical protein